VLLGGLHDSQLEVGEESVVRGDQNQVDFDSLLYRGIVAALGHASTVGFVGDLFANRGQIVLAVRILDMGQEFSPFAQQVGTASQEVTGGTHLRRVDVGLQDHTATQKYSNLL